MGLFVIEASANRAIEVVMHSNARPCLHIGGDGGK